MEKTNTKITRFKSGKYYIDIVENESGFEAWISTNEDCVSMMLFGVPKKQSSFPGYIETTDSFCKLIKSDIASYKKEFDDFLEEKELI